MAVNRLKREIMEQKAVGAKVGRGKAGRKSGKAAAALAMTLVLLLAGYLFIFTPKSPFNMIFNPSKFKYADQMDLAYDYLYAKNFKSAIPVLEEAVKIRPREPAAHDKLGVAYFETGEADRAVFELEKAAELDPKYHEAYANLTAIFMKRAQGGIDGKDYKTARTHLLRAAKEIEKALSIKPGDKRYLNMQNQIVNAQNKMPK
jgi:Tfp pilus assembly protein PilF